MKEGKDVLLFKEKQLKFKMKEIIRINVFLIKLISELKLDFVFKIFQKEKKFSKSYIL